MPRTKQVASNAPTAKSVATAKTKSSAKPKQATRTNQSTQPVKSTSSENFAKAEDALKKLRDVSKNSTYRTVSSLYFRSQVYYRLICYNANMFCLDAKSIIPEYDPAEDNDKESILKSYSNTLKAVDKMNLQYEFYKAYITCFREDVFYGIYYFDPESESKTSFVIMPLDPDYCKIEGVWETGDFAFSMDMTYFRSHKEFLEYWKEPFESLYKEYEKTGNKFQTIPPEYGICLKAHVEDWETVVPVYSVKKILQRLLMSKAFIR